MTVISFINQKGGCSKSTTSVHFAWWLASKKNKKVLLVDADAQRSSSQWLEAMEKRKISCAVLSSPDELLEKIPELVNDYQEIVIDGPASLAENTRAILFRSDVAIVPVQPTGVDLRSATDAIRLVKQAQSVRGGFPVAALFLSRAVKGTKLLDEARTLLSQTPGVEFLKTTIHQKQAIADTSGQSSVVWQLPGKAASESAAEYERLFKEIRALS
jgi:chromosome partitioning protein